MTATEVLYTIRDREGRNALADGKRLVGLFDDYSQGKLRPQSNALRVLIECGGNQRIGQLRDASPLRQKTELHRLVQEMITEYSMQEAMAREVCGAVWEAFLGTEAPLTQLAEPIPAQSRTLTPERAAEMPKPRSETASRPEPQEKKLPEPKPVPPKPQPKPEPTSKPPVSKPQPPKNPQQDEHFSWPEFYVTEEEAKYGGPIKIYFLNRTETHILPPYREIRTYKRGDGVRISSGMYLDLHEYWRCSDGVLRAYLRGGWVRTFLREAFDSLKWSLLLILIMVVYGFITKARAGVFPKLPILSPFALTPSIHLYKPSGWIDGLWQGLTAFQNGLALFMILLNLWGTVGEVKKARNELRRRQTL